MVKSAENPTPEVMTAATVVAIEVLANMLRENYPAKERALHINWLIAFADRDHDEGAVAAEVKRLLNKDDGGNDDGI